ncbi:FMN reductase [uncultured Paracoccus sp.]|uniref:FMN reductase n=1 Tax=uncultured Paracoccus sp. TaxID=189685 RepID=UPI0025EA655D|nr:FMN reductase [uncultured Paracoccus sp.]
MTFRIAAFAGSLSRPSRTRALVEQAAVRTALRFGGTVAVHDLTELQPSLGQAASLDDLDATARGIVDGILAADVLIVGSPVYKGSYAGLFKHLFDLIDPAALAGKPVLLTATGGGDKHALVIEHQLRPLFAFFEAAVLPTGVYAGGADFRDGQPAAPALLDRLDRAVAQFAPFIDRSRPALSHAA